MRKDTYLNIILTVNAILLATMLWVQVADNPILAENATAQSRSKPRKSTANRGKPFVFPNDADQRQKQIDEMIKIGKSIEATRKLIESGNLRVEVTNLGEIKINR